MSRNLTARKAAIARAERAERAARATEAELA